MFVFCDEKTFLYNPTGQRVVTDRVRDGGLGRKGYRFHLPSDLVKLRLNHFLSKNSQRHQQQQRWREILS